MIAFGEGRTQQTNWTGSGGASCLALTLAEPVWTFTPRRQIAADKGPCPDKRARSVLFVGAVRTPSVDQLPRQAVSGRPALRRC